jgi:hypothetical protein
VPDAGDGEGLVEQVAVGLDDREEQDRKTPEGKGVGQPGQRPVEQPALADDLVAALPVPIRLKMCRRRRPAIKSARAVTARPIG